MDVSYLAVRVRDRRPGVPGAGRHPPMNITQQGSSSEDQRHGCDATPAPSCVWPRRLSCWDIVCAAAVWLPAAAWTKHGPHGNLGWLGLIVALGCLPTGTFFLLLGSAKWMNDRSRTD